MEEPQILPPLVQSILKNVDFEDDKLTSLVDQLQKEPEDGKLYYELGHMMQMRGKKVAALDAYNEALRLRKGYYLAHFGLATLYSSIGKAKHAIREYIRAVSLKPDFVEAVYNLAACYESIHEWAKAAEAWKTYVSLEKNPVWISEAKQNLDRCKAMLAQKGS